jgi:SAM-dependent methyltransferase
VTRALAALAATSRLRVLDVGAGHAWTAYWIERLAPGALEAFDFIELDEANSAAILARPTPYATSRVRTLDDAHAGYHVIFLNHVLEHVAEPLQAVRRVRDLLAPGGVAYVEMPNADQRFKSDVFPHTWFFTLEALRQLAARTGVEERVRESFGRMPSRSGMDALWRAGFRAAAALGLAGAAGAFDDRIWRYETRADGIWLRWLVSR